ncbi:MAG: protein translocase subunit SecD [Phycisphaerales bacterium]
MRNATQLTIVSVLLLLLSLAFIFPPEKNLRLGKDLAGGVSLIYSLQIEEDAPADVIDQTIEVLKNRVDPDGLYSISIVQMGRGRIEVTMPLPSDAVQALRERFETAMDSMAAYEIDIDAFERAMRGSGAERIAALEALGSESEAIATALAPVVDAIREAMRTRAVVDMATVMPEGEQRDALMEAAEAELEVELARETVLNHLVTRDQIRLALNESREEYRVKDSANEGETVVIPSDRERALDAIRERLEIYPGGNAALDEVLAAFDAYAGERRGFDDPAELQRLLQSSGVLQFRIAVRPGAPEEAEARRLLSERGPDASGLDGVRWFRINRPTDWFDDTEALALFEADPAGYFASNHGVIGGERNNQFYLLLYDRPGLRLTQEEGEWGLQAARPGVDEFGRPQINFEMDVRGARELGRLTQPNVGQPMAILLDGKVYTAPNINSTLRRSVRITGQFTQADIAYIVKTLNAGSVQARLSERPISVNTLAPDLGADNLKRGLEASYLALAVVGVFMIVYYFSSGGIALFSMLCSAILILGAMSAARAAFTMPGIAGIVLTFGMAVDANVLIYERIREELLAGMDLRVAVKTAYKKVLSTIVDANITNLIVCVVLGQTATQEIRGFAITLGIGVLATMFSSLVITRLCFHYLIDVAKVRRMSQLPIAIPAIDRAFTPNINWVGLRPVFIVVSLIGVGLGVVMIAVQGSDMLDTEFRGGTAVTVLLREQEDGTRLALERAEVQSRLTEELASIESAAAGGDAQAAESLAALGTLVGRVPAVIPINPAADGVTASRFQIKTLVDDETELQGLVTRALEGSVDAQPALTFEGSESETLAGAPVYQIFEAVLGEAIGLPEVRNDVTRFVGGAAILLEDIEPTVSRQTLVERLEFMRSRVDFADVASGRRFDVVTLEGTDQAVRTAVVLVADRSVDVYNESVWRARLAEVEWNIVREALAKPTTLATVQKFSPAIAATFRAQATVSVLLSLLLILIYIRVRFGSLRYSLAAVIALLHDVLAVIGLIAFAEILYEWFPAVGAIGIQPFKIDLGLVAALLTIIGYSLNDTIIILDRVRENRGRLPYASAEVVNKSINQTLSRTLITSGTTLIAVVILFIAGGEGIGSFTYALLCGLIVGTYSSIGVAAPMVCVKGPGRRSSTLDSPAEV